MKNIEDINKEAVKKILASKKTVNFSPGDTIKVGVKIIEGKRERVQYFEGVCIAKKNRDINSSFTVRKISFGEGVERTFPLYGTLIESIKVIRTGKVRRAKLYYLRDRKGKSARIAEKIKKKIGVDVSFLILSSAASFSITCLGSGEMSIPIFFFIFSAILADFPFLSLK